LNHHAIQKELERKRQLELEQAELEKCLQLSKQQDIDELVAANSDSNSSEKMFSDAATASSISSSTRHYYDKYQLIKKYYKLNEEKFVRMQELGLKSIKQLFVMLNKEQRLCLISESLHPLNPIEINLLCLTFYNYFKIKIQQITTITTTTTTTMVQSLI
jgi:hypothetical protein